MRLADELVVTQEGWRRLQAELAELQARRGARLEEYREDPSAADYQSSDIVLLDRRIADLEAALSHALVIGRADREQGKVGIGSWVAVRWQDGDEETFVVVGPLEVDASSGRISCDSPVGAALLGKARGDVVEVTTPGGGERLTVLAVRNDLE